MFTGIIEKLAKIVHIEQEGTNLHFSLESELCPELKVDQSLAHNGVCLTVTAIQGNQYRVTAVDETLQRTALSQWKVGQYVNLERAMPFHGRMDGHMVQGHVDVLGKCTEIKDVNGSWTFHFSYPAHPDHILVDKGSIAVNGVSLTVVEPGLDYFHVAIIPYTYHHTVFQFLKTGDYVHLEFDIIGKYLAKYAQLYMKS